MEKDYTVPNAARPGLLQDYLLAPARRSALTPPAHVLRDRAEISALAGMLVSLCQVTGQTGAMDSLDHFLHSPASLAKTPCLVLVGLRPGMRPQDAGPHDVHGAVLLYEYRIAGLGTRIFATDDVTGERTAIASPARRRDVVDTACRVLLERGAQFVLISYEPPAQPEEQNPPQPPFQSRRFACWSARRTRSIPRSLPLQPTFAATLATLGQNTRRNLVRYRRKAQSELGAVFVPNVAMTRAQFLAFNLASTNPVPGEIAAWRYDCLVADGLHQPDRESVTQAIFAGVRAADGRWLSLIGGRRHRGVAEIDWQFNLAGLPRYSLTTVMRSFFFEHEILNGTEKLVFEGGTPHPMRHSFADEPVEDVVMRRRSPLAWALGKAVRLFAPRTSFLAQVLADPEVRWTLH